MRFTLKKNSVHYVVRLWRKSDKISHLSFTENARIECQFAGIIDFMTRLSELRLPQKTDGIQASMVAYFDFKEALQYCL